MWAPEVKVFRSPQENLRAHNEIMQVYSGKYERQNAKQDVNVHGFYCQSCNHAHTFTFSIGLVNLVCT